MADRLTVAGKATSPDLDCDLPEEFTPASLSPTEVRHQIALYIETAALKPLLSSGITLEQVAEAFVEVAVQGVQRSSGRVAAAVMLQKATRHAFKSAVVDERSSLPTRRAPVVLNGRPG